MKQDFRNLVVWQKAIAFVTEVYRATQSFPNEEKFGLTSQLRRASVSIPSNIAEGQGRLTRGEFRQFLGHAKGSICEVETQLIIAHNLGYLNDPQPLLEKLHAVARGLNGLLNSLTADNRQPTTDNRHPTTDS
jgi:four helix bundle protein